MAVNFSSPALRRYLESVRTRCERIDARGVMQVARIIEMKLDDIFVELTVRIGERHKYHYSMLEPGDFSQVMDIDEQGNMRPSDGPSSLRLPRRYAEPAEETGLRIEELWKRDRAWVLLGDPGAGKTTLMKKLALDAAKACLAGEEGARIPVLIALRYLDPGEADTEGDAIWQYLLEEGLADHVEASDIGEVMAQLREARASGQLLLLFDGLDEQRNAATRARTASLLEEWLHPPTARGLVTSRVVGFSPGDFRCSQARLEPFDKDSRKAFFQHWCLAAEKSDRFDEGEPTKRRAEQQAEHLLEQVEGNERLQQLASNPLLCTIIGLIHRQGGTLPQNRADLYKLCVDTFIFNWEMHKRRQGKEHRALDKDETQRVLEEVALRLHEEKPDNQAARGEITEWATQHLREEQLLPEEEARRKAEQWLSLIREVAGLVIDRGQAEDGEPVYAFFHLTFQEYLAARAIARSRERRAKYLSLSKDGLALIFQPRWREVFRLVTAHLGSFSQEEASDWVMEIARGNRHERDELLGYSFRFGLICARETKVTPRVGGWFVERIWEMARTDDLRYGRVVQHLSVPGENLPIPDSALGPILQALGDADASIRWTAAAVLWKLKVERAVESLIQALSDSEASVGAMCASALGEMKTDRAVEALIVALGNANAEVRWAAASALGKLKAECVEEPLIQALGDANLSVRANAAAALGEIKAERAVVPLKQLLCDPVGTVRVAAACALGKIKAEGAVEILIQALGDEEQYVRRFAADFLGKSKVEGVVEALIQSLGKEEPEIRMQTAYVLGEMKAKAAVGALIKALSDKEACVRRSAAHALGKIEAEQAMKALLVAMGDANAQVRVAAASALGKAEGAVECLAKSLADEEEDVRVNAASALGEVKAEAAVEALIQALSDAAASVRRSAAFALGEQRAAAAVEPLIFALRDDVVPVRGAAAFALGKLKAEGAVEALIHALACSGIEVLQSVAWALGELKGERAAEALTQALRDEEARLYSNSADALETIDLGQLL